MNDFYLEYIHLVNFVIKEQKYVAIVTEMYDNVCIDNALKSQEHK